MCSRFPSVACIAKALVLSQCIMGIRRKPYGAIRKVIKKLGFLKGTSFVRSPMAMVELLGQTKIAYKSSPPLIPIEACYTS